MARNKMVDDVKFVFEVDGRPKTLEFQEVPFRAWSELKQTLGFTSSTLIDALGDDDLEAKVALIWLERKQRSRALTYQQVYREISDDPPGELKIVNLTVNGRTIIGDDEDPDTSEPESDPTTGGAG